MRMDKIEIKKCRFVSIHAPVMDAKVKVAINYIKSPVSIHAPVMDAKNYFNINIINFWFQSTHP